MDFLALIGSTSGDRFRVAEKQVSYDLGNSPDSKWQEILERASDIHAVTFTLATKEGFIRIQNSLPVPKIIEQESRKLLKRKPPPPKGKKDFIKRRERREKKLARRPFKGPHLRIRTENPTQYWIGASIFIKSDTRLSPKPAVLLVSSKSFTGNGFFFDPIPWIIVALLIIVVSLVLWIPFVRHITRPLARMTAAAEDIARGKFEIKIPEKRKDEIGRLAKAINFMTNRLSSYVKGQRRFMSDIAHELGSPIARIQFGLSILEREIKGSHEEQLNDVMEDVAELSVLVNELLSFTRAEISPERVQCQSLDLLSIVRKAVHRESVSDSDIQIEIPTNSKVTADETLLTRALANLIRNAIRYAGDKGPIKVAANLIDGKAEITVSDSGTGVSEEHLDKLFDPFYRPESARDRESGGVGLGLTIVKTCIKACNGTVSAKNLKPTGFAVTISLNA
ncbi:MAG: HAMP domain-containing histidine kinase [Proteobacteria bacterium]|nr:HAMP domain-containing histidine kinase [Pseudomonadota bacterium]